MPSLSAHLRRTDDHGRLAFHPQCPQCREQRLAGALPAEPLVPKRAQAAVMAGVVALSSVTPSVAYASDAVPDVDGATPAGQPVPEDDVEFDPGADAGPIWDETDQAPGSATPPAPEAPTPAADTTASEETAGPGDAGAEGQSGAEPDDSAEGREEAADAEGADDGDAPTNTSAAEGRTADGGVAVEPAGQVGADRRPTFERGRKRVEGRPQAERGGRTVEGRSGGKRGADGRDRSRGDVSAPRADGGGRSGADTSSPRSGAPGATPVAPAVTVPVAAAPAAPAPTASTPARPSRLVPASASTRSESALDRKARPGDQKHRVQRGESLWSIAADLLGDDASPVQIAREVNRLWGLNAQHIGTGDPDLLPTGTVLVLR